MKALCTLPQPIQDKCAFCQSEVVLCYPGEKYCGKVCKAKARNQVKREMRAKLNGGTTRRYTRHGV